MAGCVLAACAGNGKGLDQNGNPIASSGSESGAVTADFASIQDNVLTPICSKCHMGAGAPEGLQLDAAHSYALLVGVPSNEEPSVLRIKPGDPDRSYMVLKIEGAPGIVGAQMPFGETPLPAATIAAIRQWVTNGAPDAVASAVAGFDIVMTVPLDQSVVHESPSRILVAFTEDVDASLVNESTVMMERVGTAADGIATRVAIDASLAAFNGAVLLIRPVAPLSAGTYRVTLRGGGGGRAMANLRAEPLRVDRTVEFTVEAP